MVIDVEHGRRNPSLLVVLTLAQALGAPTSQLVGPAEDLFGRTHQLPIAGPHTGTVDPG